MKQKRATVNMDTKHRICLTRVLSKEEQSTYNSFRIYRVDGKIVLEPLIEVPAHGHWMYKDPDALVTLMKGIKEAEMGTVHDLGSFAQYANDED